MPDIFQDQICQLFKDLEMVWAYINDLLVVSSGTSFKEHIKDLDIIMKRLHDARLICKIDKCYFAGEPEMEYLGYITITKDVIKPNPKKVQAILSPVPTKWR